MVPVQGTEEPHVAADPDADCHWRCMTVIRLDMIPESFTTRLRIVRSIRTTLKEMSVEEICSCGGVSRSTFYRLFPTRQDFDNWYLIFCGSVAIDEIGRTLTWREGMDTHFLLLYEEREFLRLELGKWAEEDTGYMIRHRRKLLADTLRDFRHVEVDDELAFQIVAYVYAEGRLAREYLGSGMPTDYLGLSRPTGPVDFGRYLESCVPARLHEALELK